MSSNEQKKNAALKAAGFIENGMKLGLGTGSTAEYFVQALGARVAEGLDIVGVPTSERTRAMAETRGIPLTNLDETPHLDITVDGADELDSKLRLIKGGGGALLREKIVATASDRMIVIADVSKVVGTLGAFPLPVEVIPFGSTATVQKMADVAKEHGCEGEIRLRADEFGEPFFTDSENFIFDCHFGSIPDPDGLAAALNRIAGVVDNGLFIGICSFAIVGTDKGTDIIGQ
ncbi:ribose 5-phosphate isomerase A [Parvibaculum indicum]|uniref:ribose-5-phosphate isomerase RpiA n=1 Tax=Parvibaculum indicum TaxID=562969 RepID=UPI00141EC9C8|nr:ribose-5-phosphate isomerase RpiA [Parvibaculum indicum]NIJ42037.1 ribose 5-phosphate isomerase A [Parvibaculum indicum]